MRGVLVIGGNPPSIDLAREIIARADLVAAADSGFDFLWKNGLRFDFVAGDMDSTSCPEIIAGLPADQVYRYATEKDETDTEIGLRILHEKGSDHITILGGGGGRLDHLLGVLALFNRVIRPDEWYTDRDAVCLIEKKMIFHGLVGRTVSFFPVGSEHCRSRTTGLKWPLDDLCWKPGDAGISNVVVEDPMTVEPVTGRMICVYSNLLI